MSLQSMNSGAAQHVCNTARCPALGTVKVLIHEQDFQFCQHHYNAIEPTLVAIDLKRLSPAFRKVLQDA